MLTDKNITWLGKTVVLGLLVIAIAVAGAFAFKLVAEGLAVLQGH